MIQTYCTGFTDHHIVDELLNLSRKCAVVRDDVASIGIYICEMAITVSFACADEFCGHLSSCFGKSLHTHTQSFPARASR